MSSLPLDSHCFVTSITLVAVRKFGFEILDWDPLIVRDAIEGNFDMPTMPQRMFDKLNCGLTLLGTDLFTSSIEGFLTNTYCLNGMVLDGDTIPYCSFQQCAWGIWEYANLNGDIDSSSQPTEEFCPDIIKYIQEVGRTNGITSMPTWMKFAQKPDSNMPDLTGDVTLFEQYMQRQTEYTDDLNTYVTTKQNALSAELTNLTKVGLLG